MARVLLGWELGGGRGHHVPLIRIAAVLRRRGHEVVIAAQQLVGWPDGEAVWQAPLWPAQLATAARAPATGPATMGDILAKIGVGEPGAAAGVLAAWRRLLAAVRPDVVAAEFAPGLLLAAAGEMPTLALGIGFTLPPAHLAAHPSLTGAPPVHDEAPLLDAVNRGLRAVGASPRAALPAIWAADAELHSVFAELDPYAEFRRQSHAAPFAVAAGAEDGPRDELFVYMNGPQPRPAAFWQGLAGCGLPVRVHDPGLSAQDRARLEAAGLTTEAAPVPFRRIAQRSRLLLTHGGLGSACSALATGLPHLALPGDLEKQLTTRALERLGVGRRIAPVSDPAAFAALLRDAAADETLAARARAAAPAFAARLISPPEEKAADLIEALAA